MAQNTKTQDKAIADVAASFKSPQISDTNTSEQNLAIAKVTAAFNPAPVTTPSPHPSNRRYVTANGVRFFSGPVTDAERVIANQSQDHINKQAKKVGGDSTNTITSSENTSNSNIKVPDIVPVDTSALDIFEQTAKDLEKQRIDAIAAINTQFGTKKIETQGAQKRETGTTSATIARLGGFLGGSGSGTGVLLNLAATHRAELSALASKRAQAIQEANNAINDKQFQLAKLKISEIRNIDSETEQRRQDFFNNSLKLLQEDRLQSSTDSEAQNKLRDNARQTIDLLLKNLGGLNFAELSGSTQSELTKLASDAKIPLDVLKNLLKTSKTDKSLKKDEQRKILALVTKAAAGGASQEILDAISSSQTLSAAAGIAGPFIAKKTGGVKPKTSGALTYTEADLKTLEDSLKTDPKFVKGGSTVSVDGYLEVLSAWEDAGGLRDDFIANFDPRTWLSEKDANDPKLPEFISKRINPSSTTIINTFTRPDGT